jgi:TonB family protein
MRHIVVVALVLTVGGCVTTVQPPKTPSVPSTAEIVQTRLGRTLKVTGPDYAPKVLRHVEPLYPDIARKNQVRGLVKMNALISANGDVVDVEILEGLPDELGEAAVQSVRQWKFAPTVRDGAAIPVLFEVYINFKLD